jgi:hypothetical protein
VKQALMVYLIRFQTTRLALISAMILWALAALCGAPCYAHEYSRRPYNCHALVVRDPEEDEDDEDDDWGGGDDPGPDLFTCNYFYGLIRLTKFTQKRWRICVGCTLRKRFEIFTPACKSL